MWLKISTEDDVWKIRNYQKRRLLNTIDLSTVKIYKRELKKKTNFAGFKLQKKMADRSCKIKKKILSVFIICPWVCCPC